MIDIALRLEPTDIPQRRATAWLVSGDNPRRWLEEIAAWKLDEQKLTLFVIPKSREDQAAGGLLVVATESHATPARVPAGLPFGIAAEGFYIPTNARLLPALEEKELKALKSDEVVIFHPALGPLGYGVDEALGLWGLLAPPPEHRARWALAPVDITPHTRIESIAFRAQLSLQDIFGAAASEIGSGSPEDLPPSEGEPSSGALSRGLQKLRDSLGKSGQGSSQAAAFRNMQEWIASNLKGPARDLALARSRSLMRLLDQLQKNPDEGLKRALPLGSSGLHRGIAPPAGDLGSRTADFSLERLQGGRAADFWQVPPDLLHQLRLQYLELAERERQLGRHRRAAFIYAELLGDMLGAARVLAEGNHWREAGLLYRDHLRNPLEAARCFVQARMIPEAIELYEEAGAYEQLGELYRRLGDAGKAENAFRRWSTQLIAQRSFLKAAEVLEQQLNERDEALALLELAWPDSPEGERCLERCFAMRGNGGEHEESAKLLGRLVATPVPPRRLLSLVHLLGGLQTSYPDRGIRALAEDLGRRQISRCLRPGQDEIVRAEALRLLPTLAPDDRLLAHDAQRYRDLHKPAPAPETPAVRRQPDAVIPVGMHPAKLALIREFALPASRSQWMRAAPTTEGFCAVGSGRSGVELVRCTFKGDMQTVRWHGSELPQQEIPEFLLCTIPGAQEQIFVGATDAPPLSQHELPETDLFPPARAGAPSWLADPIAAAAAGPDDALWVLRNTPAGAVISGFQERGQLIATIPTPSVGLTARAHDPAYRTGRRHLAAAGQEVLYAVGGTLYRCAAPGGSSVPATTPLAEFDETILGLEASPRWGSPHVAVFLESRMALCWLGVHGGRVHLMDAEISGAVAGFTSDRTLVAVTRDSGILLDSDSRGRLRSARFGWRGAAPMAVLRGPIARTFVIVDVNGLVRIFGFSQSDLK